MVTEKKLYFDMTGFTKNLISVKPRRGLQLDGSDDGIMYRFGFDNGYGASVVKHSDSYGHEDDLWELAVLWRLGEKWHLDYDTDITDDVIGYLDNEHLRIALECIRDLDKNGHSQTMDTSKIYED